MCSKMGQGISKPFFFSTSQKNNYNLVETTSVLQFRVKTKVTVVIGVLYFKIKIISKNFLFVFNHCPDEVHEMEQNDSAIFVVLC